MQPPPGWYQDPAQPMGHLRYWDGARWTAHTAVPPSPPDSELPTPRLRRSAPSSPAISSWPGWIQRHKFASALFVVLLIGAVGLVLSDEPPSNPGSRATDGKADKGEDTRTEDEGEGGEPSAKPGKAGSREPSFLVSHITDGDTIQLANGETVRLVGMDTPEAGECGYARATENLARLILGKRVRLTISDEDRDRYGRLLRYVDLGSLDAGLRQIRDGFAIARFDSRDGYGYHPREQIYIRADQRAPDFTCPRPPKFADVGRDCARGYSPCIPAFPPDLDCADVNGPITVTGTDPHRLDADGDHLACE